MRRLHPNVRRVITKLLAGAAIAVAGCGSFAGIAPPQAVGRAPQPQPAPSAIRLASAREPAPKVEAEPKGDGERNGAKDKIDLPTKCFLGRENGRLVIAHAWSVIGARVQAA